MTELGRDDGGRSPAPQLDTFLCKVASRCNLDCDYCYMYHHADQSWRRRPHFMSDEVVAAFAQGLFTYAARVGLTHATVLLHGGEPLLAGEGRITHFVASIRAAMAAMPSCKLEFAMQTNGVLLTPHWLETLDGLGVSFGVSLDGDRAANDRHRRGYHGESSYAGVATALHLIASSSHRHLFRGLLAVMDVRNDPLSTYRELASWEPPRLDFLFPDGTHENPPPGLRGGGGRTCDSTPYAEWLIPIFDEWFKSPGQTRVRLFENIIDVILGGKSQTEGVGEGHLNLVTIETDGEIEDVDLFKASHAGASRLGLPGDRPPSVLTTTFEELVALPMAMERHRLHRGTALSNSCIECPAVGVCGGGFAAHRWSNARGFDNPSVYCADLFKLITHIHRAVTSELRPLLRRGEVRPRSRAARI